MDGGISCTADGSIPTVFFYHSSFYSSPVFRDTKDLWTGLSDRP